MEFEIRQATMKDKDSIWNFIKKSDYGLRADFLLGDHWMWEFVNNPYWKNDVLPVWIALDNDQIIGQTCAMYVPLKINTQDYLGAWSVDTIVLKEYRGMGVGEKLQRCSAAQHDVFISLGMSEANRRIKKKFGSIPADPLVFYKLPIKFNKDFIFKYIIKKYKKNKRAMHFFKIMFSNKYLSNMLTQVANLFVKLMFRVGKKENNGKINVFEIERFNEDINLLWERVKDDYSLIVKRDHLYLNWKYVDQPKLNYNIFVAKYYNTIKGYIVLRKCRPPELNMGIIVDLLASRHDFETIEALLTHAITYFSKEVSLIECATTIPEYMQVLEKTGFVKRESFVPMFYCKDFVMEKKAMITNWFLTKGDHDLDQYYPV